MKQFLSVLFFFRNKKFGTIFLNHGQSMDSLFKISLSKDSKIENEPKNIYYLKINDI